ncbi:MAG: hypothetical protein A2Y15_08570 [Clostridiales bacterium GWF2_36_10]|nr:MAG: hypothetical protein A2Y15_08570 [Clostridiales bacterium GWF2_36_10]HAN20395.1 hypothetical protein [Clostridiales bacterium]
MPRPPKKPPNRADGRYEIQRSFKKLTGSNKKKPFYSRISFEDCERQAKEYESMLMAHMLVGDTFVCRETTFKEWAQTWLEKYKEGKVKESTYSETYERTVNDYLIPYFGEIRLEAIKPVNIEEFVKKQKDKYSSSTMKKMQLCLNAIFNTAIDNDLCRKNPAKNVSFDSNVESNKKRTYSQDEVNIIYKFCYTHKYGLYIRILLELGLRCSELCGLNWSDIGWNEKTIYIRRAVTQVKGKTVAAKPKSKSSIRDIPLSSEMLKMFVDHKVEDKNFIVHTDNNNPYTPANFTKTVYNGFFRDFQKSLDDDYKQRLKIDKEAKPLEIKALTPHELRHTCGTLLYARTKDIYAVSKYLGHASIDITTKLYVHDSVELLRKNLDIK